MRIIVTGGGTAGHVNAGITILDEFKKRFPAGESLFIGTKRGLEKELIPRAGYKIKFIKARGLNRESIPVLIYSLFLIPFSIIHSVCIIMRFKPDAVIGVGGFASGPFVLASYILGKPVFLLEQNAVMGFTNRILIRFAKKIFIAFPLANIKKADKHKAVLSGNPVRNSITLSSRYANMKVNVDVNKNIQRNKTFNIFIFGGSQGARAINNCITDAIEKLNRIDSINIIHQTGRLEFEKIKDAYSGATFEYVVYDYIHGMAKIYDATDLVIARSGASTIFELIASGVPSILIPLPTAADNHQYYNAKFLSDNGVAELIEQKKLTPDFLVERIKYYKEHPEMLKTMSKKLSQIPAPKKRPEETIIETIAGSLNA
ncbi:MAG: undecaprenyldiphospho-muramoylpentapeptide beta-N-acetylglucosaminyltransferase [Proteobacteria bacterium]|nr:undecaprenyldiphospho-muramoylpentapeptide beta-N-acetylglucosaminyltransferase [Pseudomonadota bacterium]